MLGFGQKRNPETGCEDRAVLFCFSNFNLALRWEQLKTVKPTRAMTGEFPAASSRTQLSMNPGLKKGDWLRGAQHPKGRQATVPVPFFEPLGRATAGRPSGNRDDCGS